MPNWWQDLADLVLPAECGGCGLPRTVLCAACRTALSGTAPRRVRPVPVPAGLPPVYAAARYTDEVRAALLAHKERGALGLRRPLGAALAGAVRAGLRAAASGSGESEESGDGASREGRDGGPGAQPGGCGGAGDGPVLLVPVPSARRAVRARGHDPVRRIAHAAAAELRRAGVRARVLPALGQQRVVADQSGLGARQRMANLHGALTVASGCGRLLLGGRVVLVDDLMTTGASLTEAARAVRAAPGAGSGIQQSALVYLGETRERRGEQGRGEQRNGSARQTAHRRPGGSGEGIAADRAGGHAVVMSAAVVAASQAAFETPAETGREQT